MRTNLVLTLLVGLVVVACNNSVPSDQEGARRIVAQAIRAAGGEAALARYGAQTWKEKAVYHGADGDEHYEASYSAQWPDKLKVEIGEFTLVIDGDQGWIRTQDGTREMTQSEMEEHREGVYTLWVQSLVPLGNAGFNLSVLDETNVGGRPTDGVKVSRQGHFDVNMYFDRETGLLALSETRFKEARSGREVNQQTMFSGYRDVAGVRSPTEVSIRRDGQLAVEAVIELSHVESLDERVFEKP